MYYLTKEQAAILICDFSYLSNIEKRAINLQFEYMRSTQWKATILSAGTKLYHSQNQVGYYYISGYKSDVSKLYEHLGILEDVQEALEFDLVSA